MQDFHVHSVYSDGGQFRAMLDAAVEAGVTGVGFADHCAVTSTAHHRRRRAQYDRNFDLTYERRREAIDALREERDIEIYDAVEIDYEPSEEDRIERFLAEAGFQYALGSVHHVGERTVFWTEFDDDADRRSFVDRYYETLVSLIESELFDVAAHVDVIESRPALAGLTTQDHADRVADAFERSRTIPEINAGRATKPDKPADFHPTSPIFETVLERAIPFTIGTDSHEPSDVEPRAQALRDRLAEYDIEPVDPV